MRMMPLGSVATFHNGRAFKPDDWGLSGLPIIRIENLNSPDADYNYYQGDVEARHFVADGDLLISWSASLDAYVWARGPAVLNQHIFKVSEHPDLIDREYLFLAAKNAMHEIRSQVHGATMRHITKPEFEAVRIPVPAIELQRRFASAVMRDLADAADAELLSQARVDLADRLRANTITSALHRPDRGWPRIQFRDLLTAPMRTGVSGPPSDESGMPGISIAAVRDGSLDLKFSKWVSVSPSTDRLVREGAFYIVRGNGRLQLVGRGGIAPRPVVPTVFPDLLIEAQIDSGKVTPDYLALAWDSVDVRAEIEIRARTAAGIFKINLRNLSDVPVTVPPIAEQQRIAAELRERLATIDKMTRAIDAQVEAVEALPAALLRRAFAEIEAA